MNVTFKSFLLSAVKSLLFWALAFLLFIAIRYNGLEEEMSIYTDEEFFLPSNSWYLYAIFLGIIIGIFYAIIEFLFDSYLNKREAYYLKMYNSFPVFKAGLHCGKLMIAEVGSLKKELAYHGDVINTASRIQDLCNSYNTSFLISDVVLNKLENNNNLYSGSKGAIKLKGKESTIEIFEISIA